MTFSLERERKLKSNKEARESSTYLLMKSRKMHIITPSIVVGDFRVSRLGECCWCTRILWVRKNSYKRVYTRVKKLFFQLPGNLFFYFDILTDFIRMFTRVWCHDWYAHTILILKNSWLFLFCREVAVIFLSSTKCCISKPSLWF